MTGCRDAFYSGTLQEDTSSTCLSIQSKEVLCLQNLLKSARSAVSCVERACKQIRGSDRLAHVLSAVLATGNVLNADTHRGGALAIKLDSLQKMSDVKACTTLPACPGSMKMACGVCQCRPLLQRFAAMSMLPVCWGTAILSQAAKYGAHLV